MALTKKIRFEVFKRDSFACQYCGKTPPDITLEVDHITPVSRGGGDNIDNLIAACFDCNRGKRNIPIDKIPNVLKVNLENLKEKEMQLKEYEKYIKKIEEKINIKMQKISNVYSSYFPKYCLSEKFKITSVKTFLKKLPFNEIIDAMHLACYKINNSSDSIPYFCGICWNKIKGTAKPKGY